MFSGLLFRTAQYAQVVSLAFGACLESQGPGQCPGLPDGLLGLVKRVLHLECTSINSVDVVGTASVPVVAGWW